MREQRKWKAKIIVGIVSCHANYLPVVRVVCTVRATESWVPPGSLSKLGVGASGLDVTRLLALVADLLATSRLLGAVAGVVAGLAAVVALHAVDALALILC